MTISLFSPPDAPEDPPEEHESVAEGIREVSAAGYPEVAAGATHAKAALPGDDAVPGEGGAKEVPLADITLLARLQPRKEGVTPNIVQRFRNNLLLGKRYPPVLLGNNRGKLLLVDGYHRYAAYDSAGFKTIPAVIRPMTMREAEWEAVCANLRNSGTLKPGVRREAFRRYVRAKKYIRPDGSIRSYREMAEDLEGLISYVTIYRWMHDLYPRIAAEMRQDPRDPIVGDADGDNPCGPLWPSSRPSPQAIAKGVRDAVLMALPESDDDELDLSTRLAVIAALRGLIDELESTRKLALNLGGEAV